VNRAAASLYQEAEIAFHRAVVAAAGNRPLRHMIERIHRALAIAFPTPSHPEERLKSSVHELGRIRNAIADRDPDQARLTMAIHLDNVEGYLRER
jgi:DNA-binding FadR family transcriptional regulator